MDNETLRVVAYMMGGSIASGSGEVFSVQLNAVGGLTQGQHQLQVTNIKLGTNGMKDKYAGSPTLNVNYNVQAIVRGDANGDGEVDVNDITAIVNYIQGNAQPSFVIAAADANGDEEVDVNDITSVVNIIQQ